jgi:hypothetical protein
VSERAFGLLLVAATIAVFAGEVSAGVCTRGDEDYLECLESNLGPTTPLDSVRWCLECLRYERYSEYQRWAGPKTAEYFRSRRASSLRDRIVVACGSYLDGPLDLRSDAACTLAHYGVGVVGAHDIFALASQSEIHTKWVDLAALGDPRTADYISVEYRKNRPLGLDGPWKRWRLLSMVNCLYHIPGARAVDVGKELHAAEDDAELMDRLERVIRRE